MAATQPEPEAEPEPEPMMMMCCQATDQTAQGGQKMKTGRLKKGRGGGGGGKLKQQQLLMKQMQAQIDQLNNQDYSNSLDYQNQLAQNYQNQLAQQLAQQNQPPPVQPTYPDYGQVLNTG